MENTTQSPRALLPPGPLQKPSRDQTSSSSYTTTPLTSGLAVAGTESATARDKAKTVEYFKSDVVASPFLDERVRERREMVVREGTETG